MVGTRKPTMDSSLRWSDGEWIESDSRVVLERRWEGGAGVVARECERQVIGE